LPPVSIDALTEAGSNAGPNTHKPRDDMRFMILLKADAASEAGELPPPEIFQAMGAFNEELVRAGVMLAAEGLLPTSMGARVVFNGDDVTVLDGPFAEAKEIVAGFWIIQARSRDEAVEWVKRIAHHMKEAGAPAASGETVEVRQIGELEDFGDAVPEEERQRERRLRAEVEGR
jgi:hypothetical protein